MSGQLAACSILHPCPVINDSCGLLVTRTPATTIVSGWPSRSPIRERSLGRASALSDALDSTNRRLCCVTYYLKSPSAGTALQSGREHCTPVQSLPRIEATERFTRVAVSPLALSPTREIAPVCAVNSNRTLQTNVGNLLASNSLLIYSPARNPANIELFWLHYAPPTWANWGLYSRWGRPPPPRIFACRNRAGRYSRSAGFSRGSQAPPPSMHSGSLHPSSVLNTSMLRATHNSTPLALSAARSDQSGPLPESHTQPIRDWVDTRASQKAPRHFVSVLLSILCLRRCQASAAVIWLPRLRRLNAGLEAEDSFCSAVRCVIAEEKEGMMVPRIHPRIQLTAKSKYSKHKMIAVLRTDWSPPTLVKERNRTARKERVLPNSRSCQRDKRVHCCHVLEVKKRNSDGMQWWGRREYSEKRLQILLRWESTTACRRGNRVVSQPYHHNPISKSLPSAERVKNAAVKQPLIPRTPATHWKAVRQSACRNLPANRRPSQQATPRVHAEANQPTTARVAPGICESRGRRPCGMNVSGNPGPVTTTACHADERAGRNSGGWAQRFHPDTTPIYPPPLKLPEPFPLPLPTAQIASALWQNTSKTLPLPPTPPGIRRFPDPTLTSSFLPVSEEAVVTSGYPTRRCSWRSTYISVVPPSFSIDCSLHSRTEVSAKGESSCSSTSSSPTRAKCLVETVVSRPSGNLMWAYSVLTLSTRGSYFKRLALPIINTGPEVNSHVGLEKPLFDFGDAVAELLDYSPLT
ncbi:hypothetical protein PR048_029215 [Dryococelus australis]|uniref:Uncharacterized protein n=1 Tax=Dryococelus australis TaxID=614101 RepID=A0ABQ9GCR3_9NEOP|nr:hypothetical protein PR048_029215 [Dryococelus australis]